MKRPRLLPVLLLLAVELVSAQKASDLRLGQSNVLGSMTNLSAGFPFVQWRSGHLIAWNKQDRLDGRVAVYDSTLALEKTVSFRIDQAESISIVSADMTREGKLVASGLAKQADGVRARFLALITKEGALERLIRTEPYLPQYVCAADDGNVWTVGEEWLGPGSVKQGGYSVLREYSFNTGFVRGVVERERFHGQSVVFGGPVHAAILRCNGGIVRLYSDVTHQWFEYDTRSGVLTEANIEAFPNGFTSATGLAVTEKGRVLFSIRNVQSVEQPRIFELAPLAADRIRHWNPVAGTECTAPGPCIFEILGIEEGRLILEEGYQDVPKVYRTGLTGD